MKVKNDHRSKGKDLVALIVHICFILFAVLIVGMVTAIVWNELVRACSSLLPT